MKTAIRVICFTLLLSAFPFCAGAEDFTNAKPQAQCVYKTVGERKLTLDLDYPPDWKPADKRPAVVFFSGGWTSSTPDQFKPQAEYFARRGLVCARADYHHRVKDSVQIDKHVEDAISAMRWVRSHAAQLGIDPTRIVASGSSSGGHLAACTFFAEGINAPDDDKSVSPKPNAMVLYNPDLNLIELRDDGGTNNPFAGMDYVMLKRISPFFHVCKEAPPTLFIDGTEDQFNNEIREFVQKSKSLGAPVEACFTEGEPHGFFNQPPWLGITTEEIDEFLCRIGYLGKEPKVPLPTMASIPDFAPAKSHVAIKLDTKLLDAVVGHYEFAPDARSHTVGKVTIWREGDQLVGQVWNENVRKGAFHIYPESETNFFLKVDGAQLTFIKNEKGQVTAVIHHSSQAGVPDSEGKKVK